MLDSELLNISSEIVRSVLTKAIGNQTQTEKVNVTIKSASKSGTNNFVGIVYRLFLGSDDEVDKKDENGNTSPFSLILKIAPQNSARRNQFSTRKCFLREMYMYNEVLPYFRAFEKSKEGNYFIEYPKCYQTIDLEPNECLLLEDLHLRGFRMVDRNTETVTIDHVRLYLRALAKFHAISLALKDQHPKQFQEITCNLHDIHNQRDNQGMRQFYAHQMENILKTVTADKVHEHLLEKLKKQFGSDVLDLVVDGIEAESMESASVISYGDAQQNNSLFRHDYNGKPVEICLIDWQMSRIASPITDFVYFIFCCTTKELRDAHYDEFLNIYHNHLSSHIRRLGSDPDKLFSYEMMHEHFQKFAKFGILVASMILPILTLDADASIDLDDLAENLESGQDINAENPFCSNQLVFYRKMQDVIVDMDRLGYI